MFETASLSYNWESIVPIEQGKRKDSSFDDKTFFEDKTDTPQNEP